MIELNRPCPNCSKQINFNLETPYNRIVDIRERKRTTRIELDSNQEVMDFLCPLCNRPLSILKEINYSSIIQFSRSYILKFAGRFSKYPEPINRLNIDLIQSVQREDFHQAYLLQVRVMDYFKARGVSVPDL